MGIKIIAAVAKNNAIGGEDNKIPWDFHPEDMKLFSDKTRSEGATVVMGRKTFLSLPDKFRPLPKRTNIILTRNINWKHQGVEIYNSKEALLAGLDCKEIGSVWICGGAEVYKEFMDLASELHISHFDVTPELAVAFFPSIDHTIWEETKSTQYQKYGEAPQFTHTVYKRKNKIHTL